MILVLKMIALATNFSDGLSFAEMKSDSNDDKNNNKSNNKNKETLEAVMRGQRYRCRHFSGNDGQNGTGNTSAPVSLLVCLGYLFNCGSCLAGPYNEIGDYIDWSEGRGLWTITNDNDDQGSVSNGNAKRSSKDNCNYNGGEEKVTGLTSSSKSSDTISYSKVVSDRFVAAGIAMVKLSCCIVLHLIIDARMKPAMVNAVETGFIVRSNHD